MKVFSNLSNSASCCKISKPIFLQKNCCRENSFIGTIGWYRVAKSSVTKSGTSRPKVFLHWRILSDENCLRFFSFLSISLVVRKRLFSRPFSKHLIVCSERYCSAFIFEVITSGKIASTVKSCLLFGQLF